MGLVVVVSEVARRQKLPIIYGHNRMNYISLSLFVDIC